MQPMLFRCFFTQSPRALAAQAHWEIGAESHHWMAEMDRKKTWLFGWLLLMFFMAEMEFSQFSSFQKRLESQNMSKHSDFSSYDLTEISKYWTFQHFSFEYIIKVWCQDVLTCFKRGQKDLCQVSIGQLESQCARGLASHEINVFTMFSLRILQVSE